MKKHIKLAAFGFLFCLAALVHAQEEAVDLDALDSSPASTNPEQPAAAKEAAPESSSPPGRHGSSASAPLFHFQIFGDLAVSLHQEPSESEDWNFSFGSEHSELFLMIGTNRGISAATDVIHITDYLEFNFPLAAVFPGTEEIPVLGSSEFRVGKILVPFGDYKYHHLYGGSVYATEQLMATLWTDLGLSWKIKLLEGLSSEFYILNGLKYNSSNVFFNSAGEEDRNIPKTLGTRIRYDLPFGFVTGSFLYDHFGTDQAGDVEGNALAFGLDAGLRLGPVDLSGGGLYAPIRSTDFDLDKWGWYAQVNARIIPELGVRLRAGQVDPDSTVEDTDDTSTASLSLLLHAKPFDLDLSCTLFRTTHQLLEAEAEGHRHSVTMTFYFML